MPLIILFIRRVFAWMKRKSKRLGKLARRFEDKAAERGGALYNSELIGLLLFVALPLPGTGAWTGALIAAILDIRLKTAIPAILGGIVLAGILITGLTFGFTAIF